MKNNSFEVEGNVVAIFAEQQVSDKFRKKEIAIEIPDGQYTQTAKFQFTQDKCDLLDSYKTGDSVKISFNLSGKPFNKNGEVLYFTNLQAWRIEKVGGATGATAQASTGDSQFTVNQEDNSDLPF